MGHFRGGEPSAHHVRPNLRIRNPSALFRIAVSHEVRPITALTSTWPYTRQSTGNLPKSITLDLGQVQPDVGRLGCVPRYHHEKSSKDGNVTWYRILTGADGNNFT